MIRLSKRLEMIANQVPEGSRVADIGSDHALLPTYLAQKGRIAKGIAGEVNPGPYQAASRQIREARLTDTIDVRLGNGLEVISAGEVDVITIAGMGGALIASILEAGKEKLPGVSRLVLQPNVGEAMVRQWLLDHQWVLAEEMILEEDGKIYEILTAVPSGLASTSNDEIYRDRTLAGEMPVQRDWLLKMGPYLLQDPTPVWFAKWDLEYGKLEMIRGQLALSEQPEAKQKQREIEEEMKTIREVLACLQKDKASSN
ncbi:tRNA (adenine-N(1))-methyltransferase [Paenibacillus sp. H1-7]|uniref:tRNA (adenine(22)-N(1))-methyltransferase n=1 Tax=Paenibacillus sp. H1-7 TaxID=2282849 RepID=UPI001EF98C99|nr:class I SAM-dependent methyltransferase [Paenibacillus sp. H1-7]ULL17635.1 tRNA (adenine-N(1))-methyltransferase [Paenibacillus sp. H1-7]